MQMTRDIPRRFSALLFVVAILFANADTQNPLQAAMPQQSGASCERLVTDARFTAMKRSHPIEPVVNRLTLDRDNALRWNKVSITVATLRQYLNIAASSRPMPYLIFSAEAGSDGPAADAIRRVVLGSPICQPSSPAMSNSVPRQSPPPAPISQSGSANAGQGPVWIAPVRIVSVAATYFDKDYPSSQDRQHLGVDLPAAVGTEVRSPVAGVVSTNATSTPDVMESYLTIREDVSGAEHVLGHISSTLKVGQRVTPGKVVGVIRAWPDQPKRSHVHWGVNKVSVAGYMGDFVGGKWGWGRAPPSATEAQASGYGWMNLNGLIARREYVTGSGITLVPHPTGAGQSRCGLASDVGMEIGRPYNRVDLYNAPRGWQPDGGCAYFFDMSYSDTHTPMRTSMGMEGVLAIQWKGLANIAGVQSYQIMYSEPNQIFVWTWGTFDAELVKRYLTSTPRGFTVTLERVCCISPPRR